VIPLLFPLVKINSFYASWSDFACVLFPPWLLLLERKAENVRSPVSPPPYKEDNVGKLFHTSKCPPLPRTRHAIGSLLSTSRVKHLQVNMSLDSFHSSASTPISSPRFGSIMELPGENSPVVGSLPPVELSPPLDLSGSWNEEKENHPPFLRQDGTINRQPPEVCPETGAVMRTNDRLARWLINEREHSTSRDQPNGPMRSASAPSVLGSRSPTGSPCAPPSPKRARTPPRPLLESRGVSLVFPQDPTMWASVRQLELVSELTWRLQLASSKYNPLAVNAFLRSTLLNVTQVFGQDTLDSMSEESDSSLSDSECDSSQSGVSTTSTVLQE
jgi:hypothetical protein